MPGPIMNFAPPAHREIEPNCATCGQSKHAHCGCEDRRVTECLNQAMHRWHGYNHIRDWCIRQANTQVDRTFQHLRTLRMQAHHKAMTDFSPYYALYIQYNGAPPLQPQHIYAIQDQMRRAEAGLQAGIDADWRTACKQYPTILDYYFNQVLVQVPPDNDPMVADPRFGGDAPRPHPGSGGAVIMMKDYDRDDDHHSHHHRPSKKERRRGASPSLPPVPMAPGGSYR